MPFSRLSRLFIRACLGCILLACQINAFGQDAALQTAEPKRFALLIGNAAYGKDSGDLPPLGSPCSDDPNEESDVKVIGDALASAKWEVRTLCNQTTSQLRDAISEFNDKVLYEARAFGIVYFSGHGAQVGGTNYLFGIDAAVDTEREVEKYKQSSYAPLFKKSAISLDEAMRQVEPLWGKAVVVIVDACRTNPIIDELRARKINTANYPSASSQPTNIVYAFASAMGLPAPDGGLGKSSAYARALANAISTSDKGSDYEEIEQLLSFAKSKVMKDTMKKQIPSKAGDLQRPPRFCIRGCPSPMDSWDSQNKQFAEAAGTPHGPAIGRRFMTASPFDALARFATRERGTRERALVPRLVKVSQVRPETAPAVAEERSATPDADEPSGDLRRQLRVDILYCAGDETTDKRKEKAERIQDYLSDLKGTKSPIAGFEIGEVRLVPVPPRVNQSLYKVNDSAIIFSQGSPALRDWARKIQAAVSPSLRLIGKPGTASDYMTVLVCDASNLDAKPATIYVQVASDRQRPAAEALQSTLKTTLPEATIPKGIEVVKNSPKLTEVRYFMPAQETDASRVAGAVAAAIHADVKARYIKGYEEKLKDSSVIELWLGKNDMALLPEDIH